MCTADANILPVMKQKEGSNARNCIWIDYNAIREKLVRPRENTKLMFV